jgi:hypothetical protein
VIWLTLTLAALALVLIADAPRPLIRWPLFAVGALSLLLGPPFGVALAQTVTPAANTAISLGPVYSLAASYILPALSVIVTAAITWAAAAFQRWTSVKIDQGHRDALHSAAMSGLTLALNKLGVAANGLTIDTKSAVIAQTVAWMEKSVPDALARFDMTPDKLAEFVQSKIGLLANAAAPVVAIPSP